MTDIDIKKAVTELKKFQEAIDDPKRELNLDEIRAILGHVVFSLVILIEENMKVTDRMKKIIEPITKNINNRDSIYDNIYS